ncbi:MAG: DUF2911 domain-containing protein [Flammeovirgaceae bacterium]|nr:DUF2911 domain-containing protein [Flammeovirgaceae bacterium]
MKKILVLLLSGLCFLSEAQIETPAPSPAGMVSSKVGLTDVKVTYSRPKMKGRKIFGAGADYLVPFGELWRTGANNGTIVSFSDDVKVGGKDVKKGEYLLFTTPNQSEWSVMLYSDLSIGGNTGAYNKEKEVVNVSVKSGKLNEKVETFTVGISDITDDNTGANIELSWENTSVKIPVTVDFDSKVMKSIEAGTKVNPGNLIAAANYYFDNKKDMKQAITWMEQGIAQGNPNAFWNINRLAQMKKAAGDKAGALAAANKSLELAKKAENDFGYIKQNEDLIKSLK